RRLLRAALGRLEAQPRAAGRSLRRRRRRRVHRPAERARRGDAAPLGRPRQAGRTRDAVARALPRPRRRLRAGPLTAPPPDMAPALSWSVVAAVLFAALLHASWNALIKAGDDQALDTALIHVLGCGVGAALVVWVGLPRREALPWIAASLVI